AGAVGPPGRAADAGGLGDRVEADAARLRLPPAGRLQIRLRGQRGQRLPAERAAPLARWPTPPYGRSRPVWLPSSPVAAAVATAPPVGQPLPGCPGRYPAALELPPMFGQGCPVPLLPGADGDGVAWDEVADVCEPAVPVEALAMVRPRARLAPSAPAPTAVPMSGRVI